MNLELISAPALREALEVLSFGRQKIAEGRLGQGNFTTSGPGWEVNYCSLGMIVCADASLRGLAADLPRIPAALSNWMIDRERHHGDNIHERCLESGVAVNVLGEEVMEIFKEICPDWRHVHKGGAIRFRGTEPPPLQNTVRSAIVCMNDKYPPEVITAAWDRAIERVEREIESRAGELAPITPAEEPVAA